MRKVGENKNLRFGVSFSEDSLVAGDRGPNANRSKKEQSGSHN